MDAALNAQGLIEAFDDTVSAGDLAGAEELLASALGQAQFKAYRALIHFQFGRLYRRWNKLSSALSHLDLALDHLAGKRGDRQFYLLVLQERRAARDAQIIQTP